MTDSPSIAIIGCGSWGKNLVRNFAELQSANVVCDLTDDGRALAKKLAPNAKIVDNFDAALDDVDGVVIATPAETHFELAKRALSAGRDVFVEKPMALRCEDARELVRLADENQRMLMVGHVLEYHPAIIELRNIVERGDLGKVHYIYSNRLNLGKVRREENILWSFAPHDIAIIQRLMDAMPFEITACGGSYIQPNIADVTVTNLLFDNGVRAHIYVSWLHPFKEQRLVVVGSKAMAVFDDVAKQLVRYDQHVELREGEPVPVRAEGEEIAFADTEPLRAECDAFLQSITTRQPALTDGHSGLRTLQTLAAAQRSLITNGQPVTVDS